MVARLTTSTTSMRLTTRGYRDASASASSWGSTGRVASASASASASSWGTAPPEMATMSSSTEEISPPALAQTPTERPSSAGSPIFCSYSTSSPSETSTSAGSKKRPPKGRFMPEILPTSETMPSLQRCSRLLSLGSVGTVGKPSFRVLGRDGPKRFGYSLQEHLFRARPSLRQARLYLRDRFLYGIEVRRVGRQQPHPATSRFDQLAHPPAPVRPQPVHHHHLPHTKRGRQEMLHVGLEGLLIGGSLDRHRRPHPRKGHAGHE